MADILMGFLLMLSRTKRDSFRPLVDDEYARILAEDTVDAKQCRKAD
jgi:hypothetical protein